MKYQVDLTINGHLEIEANSKEEAEEIAECGYSMNDVIFDDDTIDEVSEIKQDPSPLRH